MPITTRLYLVRHCDVENPRGILYGHLPNFGLSQKGRIQAEAVGRFLAGRRVRRIVTSPLQRAQETARIIATCLGDVPVTTSEDLIEARFGLYLQGVRPRDVLWRRPLWLVHMLWPGLLPGDESVSEMAGRLRRTLTQLLADFPGEGGVCITHGDPIQAFWIVSQGRRAWALHRLQCAKGGLLELEYSDDKLVGVTYVPPDRHGSARTSEPAADAGHA